MNKKLLTLCVSALLAGGMVTPAFAAVNTNIPAASVTLAGAASEANYQYFVLRMDDGSKVTGASWCIKGNLDGYVLSEDKDAALDGYSLWRIIEHKDANGALDGYQFVNAYGIPLAINPDKMKLDKNGSVTIFQLSKSSVLYAETAKGNMYVYHVGGNNPDQPNNMAVTTEKDDATTKTNVFSLASTHISASDLASVFGDHFSLQIGKYNDKGEFEQYALEGNAFVGKLYPKSSLTAKESDGTPLINDLDLDGGETYLVNENNEVLVLLNEKWNIQNTDLDAVTTDALKGYKFTTMTAKQLGETLLADKEKAESKKTIKSYIFRISGINAHIKDVAAPLEVAVKMDMSKNALSYDANTWAELLVAGVDETYYLTTATAGNEKTLDLSVADYTANTYVRFGENNFLNATNFWGKAWNIVRLKDNKTIVPNKNNEWIESEKIGMTVPEGQWILFESDKKQQWINRETKTVASLPFSELRSTNEANVYQIVGDDDFNGKYKITEAATLGGNHAEFFGADVKESTVGVDQTYKIALTNSVTGEPVYVKMNGIGDVELTADPTQAINFQVSVVKTTDNDVIVSDADRDANVDVFYIINDYMKYDTEKKAWVEAKDTVSFNRYYLSVDGKYLNYDANKGYVLESLPTDTKAVKGNADTYVIKEKNADGSIINILNLGAGRVDFDNLNITEGEDRLADSNTSMMYFDFNFGKVAQEKSIYYWQANGQLNLDDTKYNIYRNIAPVAPDTVAIYRTEYSDEFLFEKGDFLGMTYDRDGYNAALFVDTAYVRNNTEKPLFMLAVRPEITPAKKYCPIHGVDADCADEHLETIPGYVDADYLTSLADSAAAYAKLLDNPFLANGQYTKLAFVGARHNVDTVTVASTGKEFTITEGLVNPMLFAFRIVNQSTQDFVIETADLTNNKAAYNAVANPYKVSYVRWNNGVPVLTDNMADAEVFNVKTDLENANPTANEEIAASSVVVAGTNGAVVVKGAEGKSVIVSTILGKVVANEVLTSDNAQIAAPAGVVVVSVDGESFKVVVK